MASICFAILPAMGQEEMIVRRATISNFLTDPIVTGNIRVADDVSSTLPSTFILTHPQTGQSIYWSPVICRLIAIKNGERTSFHEVVAEGPHPFAFSLGAIGKPKFFGFRMVDGLPEFLYTYGQLSIEEKFQFSKDGRKIEQSFKVASTAIDGAFSVSEEVRKIVTADNGRWGGNVIRFRRDEFNAGFTVTYHLDPSQPR